MKNIDVEEPVPGSYVLGCQHIESLKDLNHLVFNGGSPFHVMIYTGQKAFFTDAGLHCFCQYWQELPDYPYDFCKKDSK